ncbi:MAG: TonB family protein [bacterium]
MIAIWMFSAVLFTLLVGTAAHFAESALRATRRATRWPWIVALVASVVWPVAAPLVRRYILANGAVHTVATTLPTIQVIPDQLAATVSWTQRLDALLLALWVASSVIVLVRLFRALAALARIRRACEPRVVDGVAVLVSDSIGPAVVGVMKPSVLLPAALLELEEPLRRLVLRHEDEHRRAGDPWLVLGSAFAVAMVPWNPALWWIVRRARLALEVDCDARVLATEANASQYGKLLLLISQRQRVTALAPMLAASSSHLERRITAMLPVTSHRRRVKIAVALVATIVAGIAACSSRIGDGITGARPSVAQRARTVANAPYFEFQVEKQAQQVSGIGRLRYPDILRSAEVQGAVLAQFVVDANGEYEPGSFKVLKSDHELFTQAVQTALPSMRFQPAEIGGLKVRQVVQQPFTFSLSKNEAAIDRALTVARARIDAMGASEAGIQKAGNDRILRKEAHQIPGTSNLRYPDMLRAANVEGQVLAQFVVDENGRVVPGSMKVLKSDHELFTQAVKTALTDMRFTPAESEDGSKIRQLITQPFTFSLSKN